MILFAKHLLHIFLQTYYSLVDESQISNHGGLKPELAAHTLEAEGHRCPEPVMMVGRPLKHSQDGVNDCW